MNIKTITAVALTVGVLGLVALNAPMAEAYRGDYTKTGPNHTAEREVAMDQVMTAKDYEGWKKLMTEDGRTPGVLRIVDTQEEFAKFAEAHRLADEGKTAEASALRAELGLGNGAGNGHGQGRGMRNGNGTGAGNGTCVH